MIHRLDLADGKHRHRRRRLRQLIWTAVAVVIAARRAHRAARPPGAAALHLHLAGASASACCCCRSCPASARTIYGSRIWIRLGPFSFQPGEIAKIALAIFFAGYLVQTRDALSLAGRKVLGLTLPARPRPRPDPRRLAGQPGRARLREATSAPRCCSSACSSRCSTSPPSGVAGSPSAWPCSAAGAYLAYLVFGHVQTRVLLWLDPFSPEALQASDQLAKGLMGMASGGLFGTGLGRGRPDLTYFAESDFIFPSFGEELGLFGAVRDPVLYALLVERGLRTALGVRDGFGKLLAAGLSFSVALQCFVVVGGVTRVIPLTGLTMPFLSSGGSSLLANWIAHRPPAAHLRPRPPPAARGERARAPWRRPAPRW